MTKYKRKREPDNHDDEEEEEADGAAQNKRRCSGVGDIDGDSGFSITDNSDGYDLSIQKINTSKDKIEQPELAKHENMYIPPIGSSMIFSGKSGCGKSTLLANLLTDSRFYGPSQEKPKGWFDKVFLFSPTANGDDIQRSLNIPKKYVFTNLSESIECLEYLLDLQQGKLDEGDGAHTIDQYLFIFDDIIGDIKFMNDTAFSRCFYQIRHCNGTTMLCTQHFKKVPKLCRQQANFVFFFQGSASEVETITDEFAPPEYSKKEFRHLVCAATKGKFNFFTVNMKTDWSKRFRRNLDEFVTLHRLVDGTEEEEDKSKGTDDKDSDDDCEDKEGIDSVEPEDRVNKSLTQIETDHQQDGVEEELFYGRQSHHSHRGRPDW